VSEDVPPVEYALLAQRIRRLTPAELAEAAALFAKRFGERPARLDRIALIGLRGAGKSTLGAALAQRLGWDFVELSREIERAAGTSVNEIFDLMGQAAYRRYERRAVENILRTGSRIVIAAGGGLVSELSTFDRLLESCYTVWLRAAPREHWERVLRQGDYRMSRGVNAAQAMADMRRILAQREPLYGKADARLDTSGRTPAESLRQLLAIVRKTRAGGSPTNGSAARAEHAK
jgi:XRE family aerobic/anaerobic benzoate catabolism transcriptional regulator